MKSEEEIRADFWTQKVNWLKNVLRYGAPAFSLDELYQALLQGGWTSAQVARTTTRSFFGTPCPTLQMSLCKENDVYVIQNPGIGTMELTIQECKEPVSLTGASVASVVSMLQTYCSHYGRYKDALDSLVDVVGQAAKEEAKRQKLKRLALSGIHMMLPALFKGSPYHHYLKEGETEAVLCIRLNVGKTLEISLPYVNFQTVLPKVHQTVAHMEKSLQECPLPVNLSDMERRVFDLIARRFIAVFYPDCRFSTTTVMGEADGVEFKTSGRQILDPGWRVVFTANASSQEGGTDEANKENGDEDRVLPAFVKGESGPHVPELVEKWTQPPRPYTEATLLRAMETAGKLVDNDELRDALKENGIGRPSTRAAIIETLFKRNYIRKEKKNLIATPTGVELIQTIHEELLKSAELTGIWEKKLREIERRTYNAAQFLEELKQMVAEIVTSVLSDNSNRHITVQTPPVAGKAARGTSSSADQPKKEPRKRSPRKKKAEAADAGTAPAPAVQPDEWVGRPCPLCGKGTIIKGKTAYGCSEWRNGCTFRKPFDA